jgi:hypothetical protein
VMPSFVAAPAVTVTTAKSTVLGENPARVNRSVCVPRFALAAAMSLSPLYVTVPLLACTAAVPPKEHEPVPATTETVTIGVESLVAVFPLASASVRTGCALNSVPDTIVVGLGAVVSVNLVVGPWVSENEPESSVNPPSVKRSEWVATVPVSTRLL